jgi:hypothetical protein
MADLSPGEVLALLREVVSAEMAGLQSVDSLAYAAEALAAYSQIARRAAEEVSK